MNFLKTALSLCSMLFLLQVCQKKPDFSKTPLISVESLSRSFNGFSGDNVLVKIRFQDGNGDLGLTDDERNTIRPITRANATRTFQEYFYTLNTAGQVIDSTKNKFFHNLFVRILRKNTAGEFVDVVFPDPNLDFKYAFKPLYEVNRQTPMEGIIEYNMNLSQPTFKKNDVLKFEIQLCDREKNFSNIVLSETITLLMQ